MVTVRDPVHGNIEISDFEKKLLDSRPIQRLRRIRQLAMAYLVYPGANHTRFEHSLGTMELAGRLCLSCGISGEEREKIRAAALLHDVGHICFSHEAEIATRGIFGNHEEIGKGRIEEGEIAEILSERWKPKEISELSFSAGIGSLVSSDIGADRMDYLMRDSHYTGVAYGVIDKERIISKFAHSGKDGVYIRKGGLSAAESLLIARFLMFSTVYMHPTARIASAMLQRGIRTLINERKGDAERLLELGDEEAFGFLLSFPECRQMILRLRERRLYKKAYLADSSGGRGIDAGKIEEELKGACGVDLIVDFPQGFVKNVGMRVEDDSGEILALEKVSPLVRSLSEAEKARAKIIVCCEKKDAEKVGREAKRIFG